MILMIIIVFASFETITATTAERPPRLGENNKLVAKDDKDHCADHDDGDDGDDYDDDGREDDTNNYDYLIMMMIMVAMIILQTRIWSPRSLRE